MVTGVTEGTAGVEVAAPGAGAGAITNTLVTLQIAVGGTTGVELAIETILRIIAQIQQVVGEIVSVSLFILNPKFVSYNTRTILHLPVLY